MFKGLGYKIAKLLSSEYIDGLKALDVERKILSEDKKKLDDTVNRRVAEVISQMDPFQPLMKEYNVIFSKEFERVEDNLNEQGKIGMYMWAWQQKNDIHFEFMIDWIMNKSGNSLLKRENPSELQTFYKRAEIANMILYRKEVGRLASNYEEMLKKNKGSDFDSSVGVEM